MRKFSLFLFLILSVLITVRLILPAILLNYVTDQINKIPGYLVSIEDLDLSLYRGAYTIKKIKLWKRPKLPVPFYQADTMEFSIEWRQILRGKILAKIAITNPKISFITEASEKNQQLMIGSDWLEIIKSLYPLNINHINASQGEVSLASMKGSEPYKIYINNVTFSMMNIQKSIRKEKLLSSSFDFQGQVMGGGSIIANGKFDPFNKLPTFDLIIKLNALNIAKIAPFLKHYSSIDVSAGKFSLYSKIVAANGKIKGEVKPFIKDLKIGNPKKKSGPITGIVNGAARVAATILKNRKQDTIATKIILSGDIEDPNTSTPSIIGYFLKHAFIRALLPQVDNTVKMEDVFYSKPTSARVSGVRQGHLNN